MPRFSRANLSTTYTLVSSMVSNCCLVVVVVVVVVVSVVVVVLFVVILLLVFWLLLFLLPAVSFVSRCWVGVLFFVLFCSGNEQACT